MDADLALLKKKRLPGWLFTDFLDPWDVLRRVVSLRRRGFGARVIARVIFGEHIRLGYLSYAAAVKRVQRLLRVLDDGVLRGVGARVLKRRRGHSVDIFVHEPVHLDNGSVQGVIPCDRIPRLGRTQRLVLQVLELHNELFLRDIYLRVREHGVSYRATYMALNRLLKRGIIGRTSYGAYYLKHNIYSQDNIFVENARSGEFIIHSKKHSGKPLRLREFLLNASREGWFGLSQIELSSYTYNKILDRIYSFLRRTGWRFTVIYYDEEARSLKLEHRFWNPEPMPHISQYTRYRELYLEATKLSKLVVDSIIRQTNMSTA